MEFSEKLRVLRKEKGLSQEKLAEWLTVSRQSVSKWESGQAFPEIEKLIKLSDLFGVSLDELIKDKPTTADSAVNRTSDQSIEEQDEEIDEYLIVGGFIIGMAIGLITDNFLFGTVGGFIGLGLPYVIKGIKGIVNPSND